MVVTKSVERRWFKRYKLYLILGGLIFIFQIYLALKFFTISGETEPQNEWSPQFLDPADLGNENSVNSARKSKDSLVVDDEDSHRNLIAAKKDISKVRAVNQPRLRVEELDFKPSCGITGREAISAIHRAKTQRCKWEIANITCLINENRFYPKNLPNSCPNSGLQVGRSLGCYKDEKNYRLLSGYYSNNKELNSPEYCIGLCLQSGFPYAGVQYSSECFCGNDEPPAVSKLPDSSCNMKCPANSNQICGGYFTINIYETGINKFFPQTATTAISNNKPIKIVFLLTLNGRALRQVKRLIKILFHVDHYFYIHVDIRQDYLFRELLTLERSYPNIKLTRTRFATIWGGTSLLRMLLSTMRELLQESDWQWDFVLNLSESDYPVKPLKRLVDFLTSNPEMNFVKSHGREVQRFIQKQGLDKTFVECDTHMWRTGDRHLPYGIQIDGGSDWVALSRGFVHYVTAAAPDELVAGLLVIFNHTLLPAESFFHTVLRNSVFCNRYVDNNLHVTNWKRKLGCKCQYKHVVDWCGCSPNDFTPDDWPRIQNTETRQLFFARKFEPIVNQAVILQLEQWLYGHTLNANLTNINAYWQSIYNSLDLGTIFDDSLMTLVHSILRIAFKCEKLVKVREVTSFHLNDSYNRTLVLFDSGNVTSRVELGFKPRPGKLKLRKNNIGTRVKKLQVSSDYDQKEQISRNFLRQLGPYSEPVLVYNFSAGSSANNLTVVWIDPIGHLAELAELSLDETPAVGHLKCAVRQPLLPGSWKVVLTYINNNQNSNRYKQIVVVAELEFLVMPLTFYAGNAVIGGDQVEYIHSGAIETYVREYDALWVELQTLLPTSFEIEVLERTAAANAKRFGLDLDEWVDQLVSRFYTVEELCATGRESVNVCGVTVGDRCVDCEWSTMARDPKSEIGLVNDKGGFDLW